MSLFILHLSTTFVYCYYGQRITTKTSAMAYAAYSSLWYNAPQRAIRGIKLLMFYGQQEIHFSGYDLIHSSMETFHTVIQSCDIFSNPLE